MGPNGVVVTTPAFNDDPRIGAVAEPLQTQAFVAEFAVEALAGAILPRLAGVDMRRVDLLVGKPLQDRLRDELRAIVIAKWS